MSRVGRVLLVIAILFTVYLIYLIGFYPMIQNAPLQGNHYYVFPFFSFQPITDEVILTNDVIWVAMLFWLAWGVDFIIYKKKD